MTSSVPLDYPLAPGWFALAPARVAGDGLVSSCFAVPSPSFGLCGPRAALGDPPARRPSLEHLQGLSQL